MMAKRAMDVASRLRPGGGSVCSGFAAKGCRTVLIMQRFRTPGHHEAIPRVAVSILSRHFVGEFMRYFILSAACIAAIVSAPAFAEEQAAKELTRIEIDQEAKAFIFIIDGEPVAMLDKAGLQVPGKIDYGLYLTDTGPDWIKDKIASRGKEASDD